MKTGSIKILLLFLFLGGFSASSAQVKKDRKTVPPIIRSLQYEPIKTESGQLRDPVKYPPVAIQDDGLNPDRRMPYSLFQLELRGITFRAGEGYIAIFKVGDAFKWWQAGAKFEDSDLVNITDEAVFFKHYLSGDDLQVRAVVKVLQP